MSDIDLSKLAPEGSQRDAIHVAVVPLIAGENLHRSDDIKLSFCKNKAYRCERECKEAIGIVSPFLEDYTVKAGDRFWAMLYQNTVTGMRHHWSHPSFDTPAANVVSSSEVWLREFADKWHFDYDQLIKEASRKSSNDYDRYIVADGIDLHSRDELGEDYYTFWTHLEVLTGKKFDQDHREDMGWSCSC